MDINTLRIAATVVSLMLFLGIMIWAWRKRGTTDFKEAANLPFDEDK